MNDIFQWINLLKQNGFGSETKYKSLQNSVYGDPVPTSATAVLVHSSMKHMIVSFVHACSKFIIIQVFFHYFAITLLTTMQGIHKLPFPF